MVHYVGDGCPTVHIGSYASFSEDQFDWAIYPQPSMRHETAHSVAVTAASATRTGASRRTSRTYQRRGARGAQLRRCQALFGCRRPAGHADTPLDDQQAMQGLHQTNCFMLLLDDAQCNKNTGMLDDALLLDDRAGQPAFQPGPTERDLVRPCGAL